MLREMRGISHDYQANMHILNQRVKCDLANDLCLSSIYHANNIYLILYIDVRRIYYKEFAKLKLYQCVCSIRD